VVVAVVDTPVAAVAVVDTPVAAAVADIQVAVAAADIWVEAEVATARVAAWAVAPRQAVRGVPHWGVTAPLWRIMAPHVRTPCTPTTRFRANMPRAKNMRLPGLREQIIITTTTTPLAASP
jgi:hypothetical protein